MPVDSFREKSLVEVPLIYTHSIGEMAARMWPGFAFRISTKGEAVDIMKNIVEQHVGEFIHLIPLAKN